MALALRTVTLVEPVAGWFGETSELKTGLSEEKLLVAVVADLKEVIAIEARLPTMLHILGLILLVESQREEDIFEFPSDIRRVDGMIAALLLLTKIVTETLPDAGLFDRVAAFNSGKSMVKVAVRVPI